SITASSVKSAATSSGSLRSKWKQYPWIRLLISSRSVSIAAPTGSDEFGERRMDLRQACLEFGRTDQVDPGALELATQSPLVEPQHQLLPRSLVELVPIRAGTQLGSQRDQLVVLGL